MDLHEPTPSKTIAGAHNLILLPIDAGFGVLNARAFFLGEIKPRQFISE